MQINNDTIIIKKQHVIIKNIHLEHELVMINRHNNKIIYIDILIIIIV